MNKWDKEGIEDTQLSDIVCTFATGNGEELDQENEFHILFSDLKSSSLFFSLTEQNFFPKWICPVEVWENIEWNIPSNRRVNVKKKFSHKWKNILVDYFSLCIISLFLFFLLNPTYYGWLVKCNVKTP